MIARVALVSVVRRDRDRLAQYLRDSGFDVHVCDDLSIATGFNALVYLGDDPKTDLPARVRSWMRGKTHVVVVVTSRPAALETLQSAFGKRLVVFAPPVFGWDVVDALRATDPPRPRSA